jgi:hypothetical protein
MHHVITLVPMWCLWRVRTWRGSGSVMRLGGEGKGHSLPVYGWPTLPGLHPDPAHHHIMCE